MNQRCTYLLTYEYEYSTYHLTIEHNFTTFNIVLVIYSYVDPDAFDLIEGMIAVLVAGLGLYSVYKVSEIFVRVRIY